MGPGESYMGCLYSKAATGQKDPEQRTGPYLKGPADNVTLHHYGMCSTCRRFGDGFYIMVLATVARMHEQQHQSHVQTRHGRSVTKAGWP